MMSSKCLHDLSPLTGVPIGMYHCPECGEMVVARLEHPNYDSVIYPDQVEIFYVEGFEFYQRFKILQIVRLIESRIKAIKVGFKV